MKRVLVVVFIVLLVCSGCSKSRLPAPGSATYAQLCASFYLGLAGLQAGEDVRAREYLTKATQIAPGEPAAWADLGILQVRQQQFDAAFGNVDKARALAPSASRVEALLGLIESRRGNLAEARVHLGKAVELDPHNLKALYSLAEETERDPSARSQTAAQDILKRLLRAQPSNTAVLLEDLRLAAKRNEAGEALKSFAALRPLSANWPAAALTQLAAVGQALESDNLHAAAIQVQFLRNVLLRVPAYRASLDQVTTPATLVAQPFTTFLRLPAPTSEAAPIDSSVQFASQPTSPNVAIKASWAGVFARDDQSAPSVMWSDGTALHLAGGATLALPGPGAVKMTKNSVAAADFNYDFKMDVAIATAAGLKIYRQKDAQHFEDLTKEIKIPESIVNGSYTGVWALDVDLDGDLDLVLGVPQGAPVVLRNNGDGSFTPINSFKGTDGVLAFAAADIDGDGDPDVALINRNGGLNIFMNDRLGAYKRREDVPADLAHGIQAISVADINGDGALDFVLLKTDSTVERLSLQAETGEWNFAQLLRADHSDSDQSDSSNLFIADLDNNGALDIVANDRAFLNDGKSFTALAGKLTVSPQAISDLNADGRLDMVGLNAQGNPVELINHGSKSYHWQVIRTRAAHALGDQRMNSFGLGGDIEIRSDLLAQKQVIVSPVLHFGLGEHTSVQFARIVWPNGFIQAEFDLKSDQTILAEQRIKGSCPMLFAWNGHSMEFLKDVGPWGSALGLNVNAQGKGIYGTREWFNIGGDQLQPKDGFYDLRITAEYWETYYMDHYSLLAVDHPANSEVYTDERFAIPSPVPNLVATTVTRPFGRATDDTGSDVSAIVRDLDGQFLDTFGRGQYQGLTRDHYVELVLPADAPAKGSMYVIGQGWIHDTDTTIVKAQAQHATAHPRGLSIEVPDASGRWVTARDGLGFPKGRLKTIVLDISDIFRPGAQRKLRLRTNLELYWNKLAWGTGLPSEPNLYVQHLALSGADLRFRGFSLITQANLSSPEIPHYDVIQESDLRWRDQEGYATRYGDVRELLKNVDDRYVITSPGDELRMRFPALPPPAAGLRRDFVLICDGWVKDGDYNSTFSQTILPLPYHGMTDYVVPPSTLEADHTFQLHPSDWNTYQTRYVTPQYFMSALRSH